MLIKQVIHRLSTSSSSCIVCFPCSPQVNLVTELSLKAVFSVCPSLTYDSCFPCRFGMCVSDLASEKYNNKKNRIWRRSA